MALDPPPSPPGPLGFRAGGVRAGLKPSGSLDLAAIVCDRPAVAAAVTTRNRFPGAPVVVVRERVADGRPLRGILVNAGISNVCTGDQGLADAYEMASLAEQHAAADPGSFLVASTGVIGVPLPMQKICDGAPSLFDSLSPSGWDDFSRAVMTTDLVPKLARRSLARGASILGVCKGSGMIEPNMATMLAFLVTDYPVPPEQAHSILRRAVERSFNRVTIDGDTSTSDMAMLFSSGAAFDRASCSQLEDAAFEEALADLCEELARMIARDGEGATVLLTIDVVGAETGEDAHRIAKAIANSPLVKCAFFGKDPNWGRICAAAGRAGVAFDPVDVSLSLQGTQILRGGMPVPFDRPALRLRLAEPDALIELRVGAGTGKARVWTCDFSYDYVKINAEYTT